ncbi:MAG: hypothetical protein Q9182_003556 [Xanthomendoza sp. 2 TL-2023]
MALGKKTKKTPKESTAPNSLTQRSPGRSRSTQSNSPTSITDRLLAARSFLHSEDQATHPDFLTQYQQIQTFFHNLVSAKELFDIAVYKDVEAMLRVHGDRLKNPLSPQRTTVSSSSLTNPSPSPSKVFSSDLAYDRSSTATTTPGSTDPSKPILSTSEQGFDHRWQEGDTITFNPGTFGSSGRLGYSYPAPKMVMGFDPNKGFVTRNLSESDKEMFPGSGDGQGLARFNFPSSKNGPESKGVRKQSKQPPTQGKEKGKAVAYPNNPSTHLSPTKPPQTFPKASTLASSIKKITPGPSASVRTKRAHFEEEIESPNKRPKPRSVNPVDDDSPSYYNHASEDEDPAYNTDDLTAFHTSNQPWTADDGSEDELSKPASPKKGSKNQRDFETVLAEITTQDTTPKAREPSSASTAAAAATHRLPTTNPHLRSNNKFPTLPTPSTPPPHHPHLPPTPPKSQSHSPSPSLKPPPQNLPPTPPPLIIPPNPTPPTPFYPGSTLLIPPAILAHPIALPRRTKKSTPTSTRSKKGNTDVVFHPGDPVFQFGETNYLTALKSRQVELDLGGRDRAGVMGMWRRFRLPGGEGKREEGGKGDGDGEFSFFSYLWRGKEMC